MSRRRKPNSVDPRRPRRSPRRPENFAPPMVEGDLAELAAEAGTTPAELLAELHRLEAVRHAVILATGDPDTVRAFLVFPNQYDRMRALADFLESDKGRELEAWVESWQDDPRVDDDMREAFKAMTVAIIDGNGIGRIGDDIITIGVADLADLVDDLDERVAYRIVVPQDVDQ